MVKILKEAIKGPSIDWDNYLTQEELYALNWNLMTFEGVINRLLDSKRLIQDDNKSFDDLVDELSTWWENRYGDEAFVIEEAKGDKVDRYYYNIANHIKKNLELNNGNFDRLPNEYWDEKETPNLYKKLKKKIQSNIRLRDTDLKLGVIDKEKYDLDNKVDSILLKYCNDRIRSSKFLPEYKGECLLHEKGRNDMLNKSRHESPGRWQRRQNYKNFRLLKTDIKDLDDKDRVTVTFEVGDYIDTISFNNILLNLREVVKKDPKHIVKFDWVIRACNRAIDQSDVYVNCQCADFKYRFAYVASKGSYKYGKKEMRPADIRNPNDDKGSFCKHLLSVLSNKNWMTKVATTVNDWLQMKDVYEIRELLNYDEANMPTDISRDLGKMSADSKRARANRQQNNIEEPTEENVGEALELNTNKNKIVESKNDILYHGTKNNTIYTEIRNNGFKTDEKYGSGNAVWFADDFDATALYGPYKITIKKSDMETLNLKDLGIIDTLFELENDLYSGEYDGVKYKFENQKFVTYYAISNLEKLNKLPRN